MTMVRRGALGLLYTVCAIAGAFIGVRIFEEIRPETLQDKYERLYNGDGNGGQ